MSQRGADIARAAAQHLPRLRSLLSHVPQPLYKPLPGGQQTMGTAIQAASLTHRVFSSALHRPACSPAVQASRHMMKGCGEGQSLLLNSVIQRNAAVPTTVLGAACRQAMQSSTHVTTASSTVAYAMVQFRHRVAQHFSTHLPSLSRAFSSTATTTAAAAASAATAVPSTLPHSAVAAAAAAVHPFVAGGRGAQVAVSYWLFGCSAWVFSMVVLGGMTRLTRSGLSMTDWKFQGQLPPITEEAWEAEFEKYKKSPEWRRVNRGMSLSDFQFIYYMEYAHRMWGRALGLGFALPCAYFAARGYIKAPLAARLSVLFGLGGAQGFVGWWMVKSGLKEPESPHAVPRVSPYRLAAHLTSAFVIFSGLFWTALSVASPTPLSQSAPAAVAAAASKLRGRAHALAMLVGITALSGAFVAGNDAGRAFNTFPLMGDVWVPEEILEMKPLVKNFFENTATVQFQHRLLALTTLASSTGLWLAARRLPLHPSSSSLVHAMLAITGLQVTLGITTLLTYVPASLGTAHQAGALTLFSVMLALLHTLRRAKP